MKTGGSVGVWLPPCGSMLTASATNEAPTDTGEITRPPDASKVPAGNRLPFGSGRYQSS